MTTQIVPLESLQKIQKFLRASLTLPAAENVPSLHTDPNMLESMPLPTSLAELGDLFRIGSSMEDGTPIPNDAGRWFLSIVDPGITINQLPYLSVKPDYRFITYLYRLPGHGIGQTVALPESMANTAQLEAVLKRADKLEHPPQPIGMLTDMMGAIAGDGTPMSFLMASLLHRELIEFGRLGEQHQAWHRHRCVAAAPTQARWQWRTEAAPDLRPRIRLWPENQIIVEFFSCRVQPSIAIFQHLDQYQAGSYMAQSINRPIAFAEQKAT